MKRFLLFAPLAMCLFATPVLAQKSARDSAFALMTAGRNVEAQPMLEKLAAADSTDRAVFERLGLNILKLQGTVSDAALRQQERVRARAAFARAAALGSTDVQILSLLQSIPADGGADASFSTNAGVEAAMQQAERAYSAGDYPLAFTFYQKALALDPMTYHAALFSGDTFRNSVSPDSGYFWYARATQIDPNRETAWRYWSDVLLKHDQLDAARDKAIEALVAEPYNRISLQALSAWSNKARVQVSLPRVDLAAPTGGSAGSSPSVAYDSVRRAWKGTDQSGGAAFKAAYPKEASYRHSLLEEKAALQAAYRANPENAGTINVQKLDEAGVLDAFVLIARADAGVASDYAAYRLEHRDALKNFWANFVVGGKYVR